MKNKYFGDVNDYRKYGLLRCLIEGSQLRLGIVWMLTADDTRSDGEFRSYLEQPHRWQSYDPQLYGRLGQLRDPSNSRSVRRAVEWDLLPGAAYFNDLLTDDREARDEYFKGARIATTGCELVFFDPDNGIEVASVRRGSRTSSKFLYWSEAKETFLTGKSVVVYQHFPRINRERFIASMVLEFRKRLAPALIDTYSSAHVVFLVAGHTDHAGRLTVAADLVSKRWWGQMAHTSHEVTGADVRA